MTIRERGFTIVELLIVIVVIGILAAIVIVAYNGVTARADTANRLTELKAWEKLYNVYAATYGKYPPYPGSPDGDGDHGYCLGTGYPDGDNDGTPDCRNIYGGVNQFHPNATLNAELSKVGSLPKGLRTSPGGDSLGPYANFYAGGTVVIAQFFKNPGGGTTCPSGTAYSGYSTTAIIICTVTLPAL